MGVGRAIEPALAWQRRAGWIVRGSCCPDRGPCYRSLEQEAEDRIGHGWRGLRQGVVRIDPAIAAMRLRKSCV